jgi:hypothetical protein
MCLKVGAWADNVIPVSRPKVDLSYNGYNFLELSVANCDSDVVRVMIYSCDFALQTSVRIPNGNSTILNIGNLAVGHYLIKVQKNGADIFTDAIRKLK